MPLLLLVLMLSLPHQTKTLDWASPMQEEAFVYGPFPQCASGGWGASKTFAYCLKALWLSDVFPKNRGLIFRSVGKELRATTMATFYKICPEAAYNRGKRNDMDGLLRLNNGSEILFLHLENPDIQGIIRGLEINWFFGDQAEEQPEQMEEIFDLLLGRLSRWDPAEVPQWLLDQERAAGREWLFRNPETKKPMPPPYAMLACNPDTELHWIYRRFHPESPERKVKKVAELNPDTGQPTGRLLSYEDLGYRMFQFNSLDNKFLPISNRQSLLSQDDAFVRRNVYGQWGYAEGTIHAIPAESLIEGSQDLLNYFRQCCTLHRVMDHGESSATCCLWAAVDREANVFFYREYYLPNALISTHRANITALSAYESYDFNLADPSIFHKTIQKLDRTSESHSRVSIADEYSDQRDYSEPPLYWSPADNNELGTRNRINEYLRVDPERIHPITKQKGSPRLFFVKSTPEYPQGCVHAIAQTRSQRRVKVGTDLGRSTFSDERDDTVTDHAYDPVRYLIASRPPLFVTPGAKADPKTFFGAQQRLARANAAAMGGRR